MDKVLTDFLTAKVYEFLDYRNRGKELVAAYLKQTGDERGSHAQLARDIGMTEQTFSNMMAGRRFLTKEAMKKFYGLIEKATNGKTA